MWINRVIKQDITDVIQKGEKIVVLFGARQTGKTSLLKKIIQELPYKSLRINADEFKYLEVFSGRDLRRMEELVEGYELLFVDEGQKIPDLGIHLKILHDEHPELRIIVTGSSSFDLATKVSEPLTGRKRVFNLNPLGLEEMSALHNNFELKTNLEEFLLYGFYPEVVVQETRNTKLKAIREISESYLMKDVIEIGQIRHVDKAFQLLKLLAMQIGSEVSIHELSQSLKINHETVESYIVHFEKAFVIHRLGGFSKNLRNEIKKSKKVFFWDLGIRNYLVGDFKKLDMRTDIGALFENFIVIERLKWISYHNQLINSYFWRLYTGAEIDYIEEEEGSLNGFEIKWSKEKFRSPSAWKDNYNASVQLVNKNNFLNIDKFPLNYH